MTQAKPPTPQAVSAYLAKEFERNRQCGPTSTGGFVVRRGYGQAGAVRHVAVGYEVGTRVRRSGTEEGRSRITRSTLSEYREYLERRYTVTVNADEAGDWDTLLVWMKGEAA
jgi:transposase